MSFIHQVRFYNRLSTLLIEYSIFELKYTTEVPLDAAILSIVIFIVTYDFVFLSLDIR